MLKCATFSSGIDVFYIEHQYDEQHTSQIIMPSGLRIVVRTISCSMTPLILSPKYPDQGFRTLRLFLNDQIYK
jgi:hypothetical protein